MVRIVLVSLGILLAANGCVRKAPPRAAVSAAPPLADWQKVMVRPCVKTGKRMVCR